eukprot:PhF_6_TR17097/c0_g1_i2/m.26290
MEPEFINLTVCLPGRGFSCPVAVVRISVESTLTSLRKALRDLCLNATKRFEGNIEPGLVIEHFHSQDLAKMQALPLHPFDFLSSFRFVARGGSCVLRTEAESRLKLVNFLPPLPFMKGLMPSKFFVTSGVELFVRNGKKYLACIQVCQGDDGLGLERAMTERIFGCQQCTPC